MLLYRWPPDKFCSSHTQRACKLGAEQGFGTTDPDIATGQPPPQAIPSVTFNPARPNENHVGASKCEVEGSITNQIGSLTGLGGVFSIATRSQFAAELSTSSRTPSTRDGAKLDTHPEKAALPPARKIMAHSTVWTDGRFTLNTRLNFQSSLNRRCMNGCQVANQTLERRQGGLRCPTT